MKRFYFCFTFILLAATLLLTSVSCVSRDKKTAPAPPAPSATATPLPPTPAPTATMTPLPPTPTPTATVAPPPTPTRMAYQPVFTPIDCTFEPPQGAQVECGFVTVPEDRSGVLTDTVQLAIAIYRSTSQAIASDPVLYLHGGPGGHAVEWSAGVYEEFIAPLSREREVIVFDQRGAGLSEPSLGCSELIILYLQDLKQNLPGDERGILYTNALKMCHDRLVRQGANLAAYTTVASAADVNDIVTVLGYKQVNLYGASYGTRLAQVVMRDFPGIVRSAVLDSALPLEVKLYNDGSARADDALNALFDGCAAEAECNAAYPHLKTVFYDLVKQLDAKPIIVKVTNPLNRQPYDITVSGVRLINTVIWALYSSKYIPIIPKALYDIRDGDYSFLQAALILPASTYDDASLGAMISVNCPDQVLATTPDQLDADIDAHPNTAALGRSAIYGSGETLFRICEIWGTAPFDPRESEPLASDIPTLILAGEYDPSTPPSYGKQLAGHLGHSYFVELPAHGHFQGVEDCPLTIALAFLNNLNAPDSSCAPGIGFVVPFKADQAITFQPFTETTMGITGIVPDDWTDVGMGFYNRDAYVLDTTQLGVQGAAVSIDEWLQWLTQEFSGRTGFDEIPTSVGERQAHGLSWKLYTASSQGRPVDLALASGQQTLMVLVISNRDERDALYQAVFLPVVDALVTIK